MASTVQILSNDTGIGFGIKKCGVLVLERGKVVSSEGVEMSDGERMKKVEENEYKYQQYQGKQDEGELSERIFERTKLIMKSRLNGRNKIIAINTWAVSLMGYGACIVKWTKSEPDEIDRKTRKVMTMNKELQP